jgi:hypothetical protein
MNIDPRRSRGNLEGKIKLKTRMMLGLDGRGL